MMPNDIFENGIYPSDNVDSKYLKLVQHVLKHGKRKQNRTGVDTIAVFGEQVKFNVDLNAFPILTTKKVWFKGIVHELLWFISGDINIKYLVDNDVHIWDEWAYERFKKDGFIGDTDYNNHIQTQEKFISNVKRLHRDDWFVTKFGNLGYGTYGSMWRDFRYNETYRDDGRVDQLKNVIDTLKTNPDDRRMIVSAWHPYWAKQCALAPCHVMFQFHTEELTLDERKSIVTQEQYNRAVDVALDAYDKTGEFIKELDVLGVPRRRLNCMLTQRSADLFLGVPFNITSYSLLLALIAHCVNMVPGTFTHSFGDLHIYENHLDAIKTQLTRDYKPLPCLKLNPNKTNLFDFKFEDITLEGYRFHPAIKADVAV